MEWNEMRDHKNLRKGRQNLKPNLFLKQDDLHVIVRHRMDN